MNSPKSEVTMPESAKPRNRILAALVENVGTIALLAVLAASLSLNVWLGSAELARRRAAPSGPLGRFELKSTLPDVPVVGLDGSRTIVRAASNKKTLVYALSPTCGWCARNYANIVSLGKHASANYRVVGFSTSGSIEELRAYLAKQPLPFEVFLIDRDLAGDLPLLDATPMTLVLDESGAIEKAWMGAFMDDRREQVESAFGLTLPGEVVSAPRTATGSQ
jgi:hypothetical protein